MWKCLGVLWSYRPLLLLPIISLVCCVYATGIVFALGTIAFDDISIRDFVTLPANFARTPQLPERPRAEPELADYVDDNHRLNYEQFRKDDQAWKIHNGDTAEITTALLDCIPGLGSSRFCPLYQQTTHANARPDPVEPQPILFRGNAEEYHKAHDEWELRMRLAHPERAAEISHASHVRLLIFLFYLINYTVMVYFNVALAYVALSRLTGGNASLMDGMAVARSRAFAILQWALLASTFGMLLKVMRSRGRLGQATAGILSYGGRFASYFIIPLLASENITPGEALYRSGDLFRQKWGEVITAEFSFSLLFQLLAFPALAFFFIAALTGQTFGLVGIAAMAYLWILSLVIFSTEQVFISALYLYATGGKIADGFSKSDFLTAWGLSSDFSVEFESTVGSNP
jgi:hypothetical protein